MLKDHIFPFKKEDCILVSLTLFEVNKPYEFFIETEKPFRKRACIIKYKDKFQVKEVPSIHNGC